MTGTGATPLGRRPPCRFVRLAYHGADEEISRGGGERRARTCSAHPPASSLVDCCVRQRDAARHEPVGEDVGLEDALSPAAICNKCVELSIEVLEKHGVEVTRPAAEARPSPPLRCRIRRGAAAKIEHGTPAERGRRLTGAQERPRPGEGKGYP